MLRLCEDLAGLFWIAPPNEVVFLAGTGKRVLVEQEAMLESETWSRGIFFQYVKTWQVFWIASFAF